MTEVEGEGEILDEDDVLELGVGDPDVVGEVLFEGRAFPVRQRNYGFLSAKGAKRGFESGFQQLESGETFSFPGRPGGGCGGRCEGGEIHCIDS